MQSRTTWRLLLTASVGLVTVLPASVTLTYGQSTEKWLIDPGYAEVFETAGVEGVFVLHELGAPEYRTNDPARARTRFLPASTFKIFNALVALETGVVADEHEVFTWDGVERQVRAWNQDHDLASAIRASAVWYFQELARRIGRDRMQHWVDTVGYGNQDIGGALDSFWLTGNVRISPVEQVRFLECLYRNDLPFSKRNMDILKRILLLEQTSEWTLHGKTGWGTVGSEQVGWFVGWAQGKDGVWLFANNIDIEKDEDSRHRIEIAEHIILDLASSSGY